MMIPQMIIGDPPCSLGWTSIEVLNQSWMLVASHDPCPASMNPEGETRYYIVLPSGLEVTITQQNYERLSGWKPVK